MAYSDEAMASSEETMTSSFPRSRSSVAFIAPCRGVPWRGGLIGAGHPPACKREAVKRRRFTASRYSDLPMPPPTNHRLDTGTTFSAELVELIRLRSAMNALRRSATSTGYSVPTFFHPCTRT